MANERRRQSGSIVVVFAMTLFFLIGCLGLALDTAQIYNRQSELQNIADSAALAAALQLDGTPAGVQAAGQRAAVAAVANRYGYGLASVAWDAAALRFSATPGIDGVWLDAAAASAGAAAKTLWYAKIDTAQLAGAGQVQTLVLASLAGTADLGSARLAVAGRSAVNVAPLAVCAMDGAPAATVQRGGLAETVAYGFRQGVGYNLLQLNPHGADGLAYLVDPIAMPGQGTNPANLAPAVLNAYMCSGRLAMAAAPASLQVSAIAAGAFPYSHQLNARFDEFAGAASCSPLSAPPDRNIMAYQPAMAGRWWSGTPAAPTAAAASARPPLRTVADLPSLAGESVSAASYGVLWSYTQALPAAGSFTLASWAELYPVSAGNSAPEAGGAAYTSLPLAPYSRLGGSYFAAPAAARPGLAERRVLNVPLLRCPVAPGAAATVLAVGRFFMTVPATATAVSGEFAGLAAPAALVGPVGLFQ